MLALAKLVGAEVYAEMLDFARTTEIEMATDTYGAWEVTLAEQDVRPDGGATAIPAAPRAPKGHSNYYENEIWSALGGKN